MDSNATLVGDDATDELDLVSYPAIPPQRLPGRGPSVALAKDGGRVGPSLLDVAAAGMAGGLSGWNRAARSLSIVGLALVGLALGAGLGLVLF